MLITGLIDNITHTMTRKGDPKLIVSLADVSAQGDAAGNLSAMTETLGVETLDVYIFPKQVNDFLSLDAIEGDCIAVEGWVETQGKYQPKGSYKGHRFFGSVSDYEETKSQERQAAQDAYANRDRIDRDIAKGTLVLIPDDYADLWDTAYLLAERDISQGELNAFLVSLESQDISIFEFQKAVALYDGLSVPPKVITLRATIETNEDLYNEDTDTFGGCHISLRSEDLTLFEKDANEDA